ncbi:hypothetical protein [Nitrososphaeria virus YSH_1032793]|uniref:Uncharacterized protein n=1 Tax=Nitrososphaeria virus YSH_1032793 TaxID=3071320 RepID=A0A976UAA0_9CAUD|nr:hypothetical protein QKV91_gp04 [Yangshan Harbor Nitrososphaeria virus]UVF62208.1 hypothetical protein [Nitrososphaeria virus YSH_1032793]
MKTKQINDFRFTINWKLRNCDLIRFPVTLSSLENGSYDKMIEQLVIENKEVSITQA